MAFCICRTDRLMGTSVDSMLVSARYQVAGVDTEIENGCFVELGELMEGERELFIASDPTADSKLENCVLVCSPEVCYEAEKKYLYDFINEAGSNIRGYRLHSGDVFSLTKEGFDGEPVVGATVNLGKKLQINGSSAKVGTIIDTDNGYFGILVG